MSEIDCEGICGGNATLDDCGVCNGDGSPCDECPDGFVLDCEGVCGGDAEMDDCGVCRGDNSTCTACMDELACNFDGQAIIENNVLCIYPEPNFDCFGNCLLEIDCEGVCGGNATVDVCGVCGGDGSSCNQANCSNLNIVDCDQAWQCEWDDGECEDLDCDEFNQYECGLVNDCEWDGFECDDFMHQKNPTWFERYD